MHERQKSLYGGKLLNKKRKAFSFVEIIIVIGLVALITTLALQGIVNSQKSFVFASTYQRVLELVRQARSLAVAGKAQPDFTDYDKNSDVVTPAHYGIYFDTVNNKVILFADLHDDPNINKEGLYMAGAPLNQYVAGKDYNLAEFQLPQGYSFIIPTGRTIFYSPVFADTSFDQNPFTHTFYIFGIQDTAGGLKRCSKIHPIAGVPEVALDLECTNS